MAMATLRAPSLKPSLPPFQSPISSNYPKPLCVSFRRQRNGAKHSPALSSLRFSRSPSLRFVRFVPFASSGETETTETEEVQVPQVEDLLDGAVVAEDVTSDDSESDTSDDVEDEPEEKPVSAVVASLQSYKEALASNDESKIAEIESFLKSLEDEKLGLERKLASLSEEMSTEKDRILRISADFDNFRKRTERERTSLVTNAQGEVVESLLPVLDNFERAKVQIKVETEGEEKINNSYQSIYKQFIEILTSLGVVPVETVGNPFDPLLHEAIMREDSEEFEEGIILQEFRKGFKLGDRLLRPSMVKVSAGPGPATPEQVVPEEEQDVSDTNATKEGSSDAESA
ncbi:GrpE nucleotide exchange factor [Trema orientale]|uniref:GrpE protein homolog n=1 Tax=Trema orientale TaxID=63057 RepID=A0A2P5CR51_TREOI|nr:GrpE nucleotide exchange factor [Trema orientale]